MTFEKKGDAQAYEAKVKESKSRGQVVRPRHLKTTYKEWSSEWLAMKKRKPGTQESYERNSRNHIVPYFGGTLLHRIEPMDVQRWIWALEVKGLAPRTVHLIYKTFRACINRAVKKRILTLSPCVDIELPEITRRKVVPATLEQVLGLYENLPEHYRAIVFVGALSGLRLGEALGLCRDAIDFDGGFLTVKRQVILENYRAVLVDYTKTAASFGRETPFPDLAKAVILRHIKAHVPEGRSLLFVSSRGNVIRRSVFYKAWDKARKAVGLPDDFRFHDLRHTFVSTALKEGAPLSEVSLWVGHASEEETEGTYKHQVAGSASEGRRFLDNVFSITKTRFVPPPPVVEVEGDHEDYKVAA
ncbi:tyrosine-type recombinase/integrase [Streptomyces syringium]|uniref:tyrosine-type recombinase/integrase n=1 Tax=Streptomyces syringium TaxID=76729 RepID=UPI0033D27834